ncbi:unnamed protein product [Periconia digitata]|uniref:TAP-C domain-containing protein n=1 Tax=Periconia digitata TaxID=1303443 RepID=A0A9W4U3F3_9PLEO|nr:unnamed protein product [Periconia digitata]
MPASTRVRNGVRKIRQKRDRDGDLVMGDNSSARPKPARIQHDKPRPQTDKGFGELKVTGWTDTKEMSKLLGFLERHSARRSPNLAKNGVPPKMVKRHRVHDTVLTIWVRPEDVPAFNKINGFTFTSTHGTQKLTITGQGIRSKSPTAMETTNESTAKPNEVAEMLKAFLGRRYDVEQKLLNLNTIAEDEEVAKSGMFDSAKTQAKFFPALMTICDQTLKTTAQDKKEVIHSVTVSGNNLPNAELIKSLATTLPHIRNLDLSGNKFASMKDLKAFKNRFRFLEHLIIEVGQPGWEEELISWFPKLRILNSQQVRPDPAAAKEANAGSGPSSAPAAVPASDSVPVLTAEQEAMVAYVIKETNLKRELAVQCLEAGTWNIDNAAQLFLAQKDSLPADSFN